MREQRIHRGWGLFERLGLVDGDVDDAGVEQAREALQVLARSRGHQVGAAGALARRMFGDASAVLEGGVVGAGRVGDVVEEGVDAVGVTPADRYALGIAVGSDGPIGRADQTATRPPSMCSAVAWM